MKRPSFQFYPGDWQRDAALRLCSMAARGLWIDLLCIMHQAEPYGHLIVNGSPVDHRQIARLSGCDPRTIKALIDELLRNGVCSVNEAGVLYSRRMIRDEKQRAGWRDRQAAHRDKPRDVTPPVTENVTPQSPRPSSSSSSSSSEPRAPRAPKFAPPEWIPADAWQAFVDMRARVRKPMTDKAAELIVRELLKLKAQGHSPRAVLEQSVRKSWQDVYPIKPDGRPSPAEQERLIQ